MFWDLHDARKTSMTTACTHSRSIAGTNEITMNFPSRRLLHSYVCPRGRLLAYIPRVPRREREREIEGEREGEREREIEREKEWERERGRKSEIEAFC